MTLSSATPILRIFDVTLAKDFYLDFLGFTLDWEHRFETDLPLYAQIHRDALRLHLSEHYGDASPGATVFIPVSDITTLHAELIARKHPRCRPAIEDVDWGRLMQISDPFGNRLRFCELHAE